jgi:peptide/nickel transport system permease protein
MLTYVLKRVGQTILTAFLAVATVFVLLRMAPGDPAANYAPPNPSSEQLEAIRQQFGLDQPIPVEFWTCLQHLFQGDVGRSFFC